MMLLGCRSSAICELRNRVKIDPDHEQRFIGACQTNNAARMEIRCKYVGGYGVRRARRAMSPVSWRRVATPSAMRMWAKPISLITRSLRSSLISKFFATRNAVATMSVAEYLPPQKLTVS